MKKDYSEYKYTAFDKYKARRSNIKGVRLNLFQNGVRFYPEERKFQISVDDYFEFCSIQEDIDKHYDAMEARTGTKIKRYDSPEEEAEYDANRVEHEAENVAFIEKMKRKYRINREYIDDRHTEYQKNCNNVSPEPIINVFSGTLIDLYYGEGILDFIYADFVTPIREQLTFYAKMDAFKNALIVSNPELADREPVEHKATKIYDRTQELVDEFFDYQSTFSIVRNVAYASLYSAICPPKFAAKYDVREELKRYGSFLLELQEEYLELLEFCFDETFYNGALSEMHPSEKFALYRRSNGLPASCSRKESVGFTTRQMTDTKMPFGITDEEFSKRMATNTSATEDQKALAEKIGVSVHLITALNRFPHFMEIQYDFSSLVEILELEFTKMLEANVRFRKCKRCGKYFIMKGNYDTNYCDRVAEGETRNCQELAAAENYKARIADNQAIPIYNKYYKRYAARVRVKQIKEDAFKKWKYQAIALRDDCADGKITVEEYIQWMEDSFPNRKPKT